jgi:hypothetical protein
LGKDKIGYRNGGAAALSAAQLADSLRRKQILRLREESDIVISPCRVWIKVRNPASIVVVRERSEIWNR